MSISWISTIELVNHELQQQEEEGRDVASLEQQWKRIRAKGKGKFATRAERFYYELQTWKSPQALKHAEPIEFRSIRSQAAGFSSRLTRSSLNGEKLYDKILGGWLGRSAGCLLGKPVEKISREGIRTILMSNGTWPLTDYITEKGIPKKLLRRYPWNRHNGRESLKENILCMPEDDDMNYPMANLAVAEEHGRKFTTKHIAETWLTNIPVLSTFTAERVAYLNYLNGLPVPSTSLHRNPYREWIGARIRADVWGWISPGRPARAAEYAWRDARLSHVRNGAYAEMFFASAIAACFTRNTVGEVIDEALQFIPHRSRFADAVRFVMSIPIRSRNWEETVGTLYDKFGKYHWVHSLNNSALVVAALLSGDGDYEQAICNAVMGGWDTDSNGATVGSIMGTLIGAKRLPSKWIRPLHDQVRSSLKGFDNAKLSTIARRTLNVAKAFDK